MKRCIVLFVILTTLLWGCTVPPEPVETPTEAVTLPVTDHTEATSLPTEPEPSPPETEAAEPTEPAISQRSPADSDFVRILEFLPSTRQAPAYATENNFTGQPIYEFSDSWLRYGTVKKLIAVSRELEEKGLYLLIWDGFRPVSAQFTLWEVCPDPTYVANPETGHSSHSRGNTVDLTLVDINGMPLEMPTSFDDFSPLADRDYSDCTETARENALLLQESMEKHGFSGYFGEWWHYSDTDSYPVEESFTPISPVTLYADCNEFITLRTAPDTAAEALTRIPKDDQFQALAEYGDFFYVDYQGLLGYVLQSYSAPTVN